VYAPFERFCRFLNASVRVFSTACDSASITQLFPSNCRPFSFIFNRGNRKVGWVLFPSYIRWWKRKCEKVRFCYATTNFFIAKVRAEVFVHFHAVAVKRHSSKRNWLSGHSGRIYCEQFPWCRRKWWTCPWLSSSSVSPFSFSVSLDFPCKVHAFFPERLCNLFQGLSRAFSEICHPLSDPSRYLIRSEIVALNEGT
jgi:hypothetical protein